MKWSDITKRDIAFFSIGAAIVSFIVMWLMFAHPFVGLFVVLCSAANAIYFMTETEDMKISRKRNERI